MKLAQVLRRALRDADLGGRFGGEEFLVIAPETDANGATLLAERIRAAVEKAFSDGEEGLPAVTVSLGVGCTTGSASQLESSIGASPGELVSDLVETADQAMYRAKRAGRNRVEI